jgi:3-deoxy-manno-octulosonate cytidylyltransferase (CMP-KDO synthetase)
MTTLAVIPARYRSSRFPGKPLAMIAGKPMIAHVWNRVKKAERIDRALVATDDDRIIDACRHYGIDAIMTGPHHPTGGDRVAEVAANSSADIYVNVQGDEPTIAPAAIDKVVACLEQALPRGIDVATAYLMGATPEQEASRSVVHLVPALDGTLMILSRLPVPCAYKTPYQRNIHLGLYAYSPQALVRYATRDYGPVGRSEDIELLRFLEYGERIACVAVSEPSIGVDHPEDIARVEALLAREAAVTG